MRESQASSPLMKALWYIEHGFQRDLGLDEIAAAAGLSRFHLSRCFPAATGLSVSAYLRGRRLSVAAEQLASGAPDILTVAIMVGYGSHEAFTRAFGMQFGLTPDALRNRATTRGLPLTKAIAMPRNFLELDTPLLVTKPALRVVGLGSHFTPAQMGDIPSLWQRLQPHLDRIPGQLGRTAFGVVFNADEDGSCDYLAGVATSPSAVQTPTLVELQIPSHRYAVFASAGHVSTIRSAFHTIWNHWLPDSGLRIASAPLLECYPERFDPVTGNGGYEIWMPIEN
jgi:AraC family transcriptional regulator